MATTIDTLRLAKRFKDARLTDEQAELLAEVFRETREAEVAQLATKSDLALLREELGRRIDEVGNSLGRRIDEVENSLGRRIDEVENALGRRMDGLDHRLDGLEQRLVVKLGGMMAAAVVLVGALVALL